MPGWQSKSPCSRRCCSSRPMRCKHLIAGPVILPQAKPADGNPRHSVNLPMLCACKGRWFRWWCLVVTQAPEAEATEPAAEAHVEPAAQAPIELTEAIDISEEVVLHERLPIHGNSRRGRLNLVLWRTPRPLSPWAAPLQKRSILRSSPRLSRSLSHRWPLQKRLPVLDAAAEPGADSPVDLSLPDLSFLDADVPAAAVVEETPLPEEPAVFEELPALDEVPALDFGATVESAQEAPAMESEPEEVPLPVYEPVALTEPAAEAPSVITDAMEVEATLPETYGISSRRRAGERRGGQGH